MRVKKAAAFLMVLVLLVAMAPPGGAVANAAGEMEAADFKIGASSSEMITGGGRIVSTSDGTYILNDSGQLMCGEEVLATGNLSCLNFFDNAAFFVRQNESGAVIERLSLDDGQETEVAFIDEGSVKELYVVNGSDFYLLTDDGVELYSSLENNWTVLQDRQDIFSFVPTAYGVIYATGTLFHYDLHGAGKLLESDVDGYYVDEDLNGGSLVFTKAGNTYQMTLQSLFFGDCVITDFMGYGTVEAQELLSNLDSPDGNFPQNNQKPASRGALPARVGNRKTLSQGVQNIVKRAYQMTNIQWTPLANITGWNNEMTYYAGQTYTGLPYGQPVYASYVPWSTSLTDFIGAVNNPNSKMYTSQSTYDSVAPYYSCDCSAFVSWAWNLNSRQTTSSIPNYATLVSSSTYTGLQVGDCFCKRGSHVVLVTDITYDDNGAINGVEISESTVNMATNYNTSMPGWAPKSSEWQQSGSGTVNYVSSWPSGFSTSHSLYGQYNNSPKSASETATDKTVINSTGTAGWIYYHWCRGTYTGGPINRATSPYYTSEFNSFHAFFSTTNPNTLTASSDGDGSYTFANSSCCTDSHWYYPVTVSSQSYTTYKKLFTYERWTDWSAWGTTPYTASSTRKVETRTVYRYITTPIGEHTWDDGEITTAATCTENGVKTYTCSICGETKSEAIEKLEHDYQTVVTDPTCTEQGFTTYTCSRCNDSYIDSYVDALGHDFVNGVCSRCGEHDGTIVYGDTNSDGEVDTLDSIRLVRYLVDMADLTDAQKLAADVNHDNDITTTDAIRLVRYLVGFVDDLNTRSYPTRGVDRSKLIAAVTIPDISGEMGEYVTVPVSISGNPGFAGFTFELEFSQSLMLVEVSAGPLLKETESGLFTQNIEKCLVNWTSTEDIKEDGDLFYLTFQVLDTAEGPFAVGVAVRDGKESNFAKEDGSPIAINPFKDMPTKDNWAFASINWALANHITLGTSATTFSPDKVCTRAEVVTFLWREAGSPEPTTNSCGFTDVKDGSYYEKAVIWAAEKGIAKGTSESTFSPNKACTRAEVVTFLWRANGSSEANNTCKFTDVESGAYYERAVIWAAQEGVTVGTAASIFGVGGACTRAQIVTFLYRNQEMQ